MNGVQWIEAKTETRVFHLELRDKISFIQGDSGSGKSLLVSTLLEASFNTVGFEVRSSSPLYILQRTKTISELVKLIGELRNTIVITDEYNNDLIRKNEFIEYIDKSNNYFLIVSRHIPINLTVSTRAMYRMVEEIVDGISYFTNKLLFDTNVHLDKLDSVKAVVVEDENSGFEVFRRVFEGRANVVTSHGNSNMRNIVRSVYRGLGYVKGKESNSVVLAIVDCSAFGALLVPMLKTMQKLGSSVILWLPISFEEIVLRTGVFDSCYYDGSSVLSIRRNVCDYIDNQKFKTCEKYLYDVLSTISYNEAKRIGDYSIIYNKSISKIGEFYYSKSFIGMVMDVVRKSLLGNCKERVCPVCSSVLNSNGVCTNVLCDYVLSDIVNEAQIIRVNEELEEQLISLQA